MLRSGGFHFLRLFQFVSPIFTVLAVEQLAEIIFFKHAEKVEHVGRCKIERGETGELRPPDLTLVGRAQRSGKLLRAIEQHDMTHALFAPVLDPAQARRGDCQTCLLLNLTNDGICKGLTLFNMTARKSNAWPVGICAVLHQNLAAAAEHAHIHQFDGLRAFPVQHVLLGLKTCLLSMTTARCAAPLPWR